MFNYAILFFPNNARNCNSVSEKIELKIRI